ncbi:OmpW family protein [Marinicauda salina]|uniref:OmpW family protein n=1 Tax=Marinicauda salina TaxID=2135793 RepID=A0A2U2BV13_9PROT|nr:OmpW family outer membrane protein [Marinicauda salina]PWE17820.1 OmpW family protein [Marinicauda salina]
MKVFFSAAASALVLAGLGAPAFADQGEWRFRVRAITVQPDESADITPIGGDVDIDASVVPEFDISYFLTDNIAAELILGVTPHDVTAVGTSLGDVDLGETTLLPPTLTLQYHFAPDAQFQPYVGAGINYTTFFNEDLPGGSPLASIDYDDSVGAALQAGFDYKINERWFFNVDVKKVWINTDVTIDAGGLGIVEADVDIDPVIVGVGVGWRY